MSHWCFFCASTKLTHRYNTRANHSRIMEHVEQENGDLKDDIARLTAMMEGLSFPNFVPEGFVPTFASMPASSPVMFVPPPVVHTLPRVEDTIYHSESSEGPDLVRCRSEAFVKQYKYNVEMAPDRDQLRSLSQKDKETFKEYAQRWRELAA
ncbi:hypothetical protein KIW84_062545 [Lathyrus oleraceus]|uniref:Retrotransposon gag domain-containing protein n=1 Tax=Pisum sativum TaxID=3888 RepID=A0A9D4W7W0_PEA|nr:hypothetical protein KIW84_062545 [Pisum sativum]